MHGVKKLCGNMADKFEKYVVCPRCHSIYLYADCFTIVGGRKVPKNCPHIAYPKHSQSSRRKACNETLLSEVTLANGTKRYYPRKVYCYMPLISSLSSLLEKEGIVEACEHWRLRSIPSGVYGDIYDGRVWKQFQYVNSQPFLAAPHNIALMLNVDWFNPFKHSPYSVGALYLVVLNLPRSERYKISNVHLVGLIPGPTEPRLNLNSYLEPLVDELKLLWNSGITVRVGSDRTISVRAALLCASCDIPAIRKTCGFLGHHAKLGCSKCTKVFSYNETQRAVNYAGFEDWPLRLEQDHRRQAQETLDQVTPTKRAEKESLYGTRYTALMLLPYFNCVKFHVVDPMHNLFLGTARHMVKNLWIKQGNEESIISKAQFLRYKKEWMSAKFQLAWDVFQTKLLLTFAILRQTSGKRGHWYFLFTLFLV